MQIEIIIIQWCKPRLFKHFIWWSPSSHVTLFNFHPPPTQINELNIELQNVTNLVSLDAMMRGIDFYNSKKKKFIYLFIYSRFNLYQNSEKLVQMEYWIL